MPLVAIATAAGVCLPIFWREGVVASAQRLTLALFAQGLGTECEFIKAAYCPTLW